MLDTTSGYRNARGNSDSIKAWAELKKDKQLRPCAFTSCHSLSPGRLLLPGTDLEGEGVLPLGHGPAAVAGARGAVVVGVGHPGKDGLRLWIAEAVRQKVRLGRIQESV